MFVIFLNKRGLKDRKYVHFLSPKTIFVTQCMGSTLSLTTSTVSLSFTRNISYNATKNLINSGLYIIVPNLQMHLLRT